MILTIDGKDYDWQGEYQTPGIGQNYLSDADRIGKCTHEWTSDGIRAILHPVPVTHTFGGIVYEETGEKRPTVFGEWFISKTNVPYLEVWQQNHSSITAYIILKPVEVVDEDD